MDNRIKVSFIIVDYNAGELLLKCINSIVNKIKINYEIIIFDNASDDDERLLLENIGKENKCCNIIFSNNNIGFAKANNRAAGVAKGEILHFLNPDTTVDFDLNDAYMNISDDGNDYIYGTTLYEGADLVGKSHSIEIIKNYFRKIVHKDWKYYIGASVVVKKDVFFRIGGWPTDYFMYMEDVDLFYTAARKGVQARGIKANIQHLGGGTTRRKWDFFEVDVKKEIAMIRFYKKYNLLLDYVVRRLIFLIKHVRGDKGFIYNTSVIYKAWKSK